MGDLETRLRFRLEQWEQRCKAAMTADPAIERLASKLYGKAEKAHVRQWGDPRYLRGRVDHIGALLSIGDLDGAEERLSRLDRDRDSIVGLMLKFGVARVRGDRGAPKGSGKVEGDAELLSEVVRHWRAGGKITTAAREVLKERGVNPGQLKSRADYIAKLVRKSGK